MPAGIFEPCGIVARNDAAVRAKEDLPLETTVLAGEIPDSVSVRMNGLNLTADLLHGQKTGIFLDQRENYLAAARYARGGKALDCFTSTGGFALHLAAKCESVEAVDSSGPALDRARQNAAANDIGNIDFREGDVFEVLHAHNSARREFSLVVLDPPAFTKSRKNLDAALPHTRRSICARCACCARRHSGDVLLLPSPERSGAARGGRAGVA